jgi:hypothetical protein
LGINNTHQQVFSNLPNVTNFSNGQYQLKPTLKILFSIVNLRQNVWLEPSKPEPKKKREEFALLGRRSDYFYAQDVVNYVSNNTN